MVAAGAPRSQRAAPREIPAAPALSNYLDVLPGTILCVMLTPVITRRERCSSFHLVASAVVLGAFNCSVFKDRFTGFVSLSHLAYPFVMLRGRGRPR